MGRGDLAGGLGHARRARALLDPLVAAAPTDTDLRLQLSAANNLLGQISLEEGKIAQALEYHRADLEQFQAAPELERRRPAVRHAISVTYGYLADAQSESADLAGALESRRRSRALRRELSAEFPDNATYAELAAVARYYEATALGNLGRWEEALALHREGLAEDSTGAFGFCRLGEALGALGRHEESLGYLRRALRLHEQRAAGRHRQPVHPTGDGGGFGTHLQGRRPPRAAGRAGRMRQEQRLRRRRSPWTRATPFPGRFSRRPGPTWVRPMKPWPAVLPAAAEDRRNYRLAARERHRKSHEIWSDLKARGLVSPVDTGRVSAAARALARGERLVAQP